MAVSQPFPSLETFLARHPEIHVGRTALEDLQARYDNDDTFTVVNKPFDNAVMYQTFNADTSSRIYAAMLVDDEPALKLYHKESADGGMGVSRCDCATDEGPEHLLYDHVIEQKPNCQKHKEDSEPDPACSSCWPVFTGGNCKQGNN